MVPYPATHVSTSQDNKLQNAYEVSQQLGNAPVDEIDFILDVLETGTEDEVEKAAYVFNKTATVAAETLFPHLNHVLEISLENHEVAVLISDGLSELRRYLPEETVRYHYDKLLRLLKVVENDDFRGSILQILENDISHHYSDSEEIASIAVTVARGENPLARLAALDYLRTASNHHPDAIASTTDELHSIQPDVSEYEVATIFGIFARLAASSSTNVSTDEYINGLITAFDSASDETLLRLFDAAEQTINANSETWSQVGPHLLRNLANDSENVRSRAGQAILTVGLNSPEELDRPTKIADRLLELDDEFGYSGLYGQDVIDQALANLRSAEEEVS